jgi:hypothetical protein
MSSTNADHDLVTNVSYSITSCSYTQIPTIAATSVATNIATMATGRASVPSIAMLVSVAKIPPAGVNPPYMSAWKIAAREPIETNGLAPSTTL